LRVTKEEHNDFAFEITQATALAVVVGQREALGVVSTCDIDAVELWLIRAASS
jgi:hypothetical protein